MDDVRITRVDAPAARPRRRWRLALLACVVAAPLMSGSASALTGGSGSSAAEDIAAPAVKSSTATKRDGHLCRKDRHRRGMSTRSYRY